ncbi:hypothetical protein BaRGS_00032126 [Batillaria attramentaria]|uniref:Ion transport domain-containing protein n=1 Tax=Batillaria attramentaria TaxID=370345 RepID=A0ABD0JP94_9CAEN
MIISSKYWESALRSKTRWKDDGSIDTPMRKLIRQMPNSSDGNSGSEVYDENDMLRKDAKPYTGNFFIRKKNHPLNVMLECDRQELFKHPVVKSLMKSKWHWIYRALYMFSLVMYCMFLAALTGFLIEAEHPHSPNASLQAESDCMSQDLSTYTFEEIAAYIVMVLCVTNVLIELFQFFMARKSYLTYFWTNSFDWITSVTAFAFVFSSEECYRKSGYRTQMFPLLGIYVVMFTHTVITFAKFFFVAIIFTVAFGLAFYTVLHQEGSFEDVPKSLIKTWAMMIGELDFSDIFNDDMNKPAFPVLAYILFVVFMIIMSILIMNLLVGLAVGDIQAVQNTAARTRLETEIELILDVELFTPKFLLPKTVSRRKKISRAPTGCRQWFKRCWSRAKPVVVPSSANVTPPETEDELSIEERLDEMSDMMRSLMKACKIDTAEKKGM